MARQSSSVTIEILKALIPYSEQSFKLAFKPKLFFYDLERITAANEHTIRTTFSRAKSRGYIEIRYGNPVLSDIGKAKIPKYFKPALLKDWLIVAFDIPETQRYIRFEFRKQLKNRGFQQLQKSVWYSKYDYAKQIYDVVSELKITSHVNILYATPSTGPKLKV